MCVRRWRPGDRCVSFHHYLQGSPGEPGVPGRDGLKGEKVGKLQIKFSPQRKIWSYDVLSQVEHARQLVKTPFRLLAPRAILNHVVTLCSRLWCIWLLCYFVHIFFIAVGLVPNTVLKVEKCTVDMHIWCCLSLVKINEAVLKTPHPLESLCYTPGQRSKPKVLKPPTSIHIYNPPLSSLPYWCKRQFWLYNHVVVCE